MGMAKPPRNAPFGVAKNSNWPPPKDTSKNTRSANAKTPHRMIVPPDTSMKNPPKSTSSTGGLSSNKSTPTTSPETGNSNLPPAVQSNPSSTKTSTTPPERLNPTTLYDEQLDDGRKIIRKGPVQTGDRLLDLFSEELTEGQTQVTLLTLRNIGDEPENTTFLQFKDAVRLRLDGEIDNWKKVDGSFVQYEGFALFSGVPALMTEFIEGTGAKEYLAEKSMEDKQRLRHFIVDKKGKAEVSGYCFNRIVEEEFEKFYNSEDHRRSVRYAAPEFLERRTTDEHTDVYSFALVAMELLTGVQPFASISQEPGLIGRVKQGDAPFAEDLAKDDAW
ncbi:hypothetical protein FRC01_008152 [Tulasnella sp. 417]|nr:hypothetical protein FRC01_008152 [Tulasnella sp. 417]